MEDESLNEIENLLKEPLDKERVRSIIILIRKLIEKLKLKINYKTLIFYCNWPLHPEIEDIKPEIKEIFEKFVVENKNGEFTESELNFATLSNLQTQMILFAEEFKLDTSLLKNRDWWHNFKRLFINIISGCPLKNPCEQVEYFVFRKPTNESGDIDWEMKFKNNPEIFHSSLTELDYKTSYDFLKNS